MRRALEFLVRNWPLKLAAIGLDPGSARPIGTYSQGMRQKLGIARALNCSRRHLYNAFAGEGESIAGYIQRVRLQACVRDLQAAGPHGRPITDIAMSWGFGNLSHFSRVFREHTGASPSEFRNTPHAPSRMGQTPH